MVNMAGGKPRCKVFAKETTPKSWEMAGSYAFNHAQAGFVGGAGGYALEANVVGAENDGGKGMLVPLKPPGVPMPPAPPRSA